MKYRLGFVTNSSSTSFLIVFNNEEDMEKQKETYKMWYPEINIDLLFDEIEQNFHTIEEIKNDDYLSNYFYDDFGVDLEELKGKIISIPHFGNDSAYAVFEYLLKDVIYGLQLSQCSHH